MVLSNAPSVTHNGNDKFGEEISADRLSGNLEKILNSPEECIDQPMDKLDQIQQKNCEDYERQLYVVGELLKVQGLLKNTFPDIYEDVDLLYDQSLDKYRFKLFNNPNLVLDIDLDANQIYDFGVMIVKLMNNLFEIESDSLGNYNFVMGGQFLELTVPMEGIGGEWLGMRDKSINTDTIQDIFKFSPESGNINKQSNQIIQKLDTFFIEVQKYIQTKQEQKIKIEK